VAYFTYLGGSSADWALGVAVDSGGKAFIAGYTFSANFPQVMDGYPAPLFPSSRSSSFLTELSADGSQPLLSTQFGGNAGIAFTGIVSNGRGRIFLTGAGPVTALTPNAMSGFVPVLQLQFPESISVGGFSDAIAFQSKITSPGSIVALFGLQFADSSAGAARIPLPLSLNGASVTVDGVSAPLFYAGPGQINLQIPWETKTGIRSVVVTNRNGLSAASSIQVVSRSPVIAVDLSTNHAIASNEDGGLNTAANPAQPGSVITLYLIGQGPVANQPATGAAAPSLPLASALSTSSVKVGSGSGQVEFLGLSPGSVGLAQANIRLPGLPAGDYPLVLTVGTVSTNSVIVSIGGSK
jgi:uncharacterized protein (TIGR03437 family)